MLLFVGIYMHVYNIRQMLVNYEYVLGNMAFVYLALIPLLTMRVIAEERKQKTDQLLYSLPVSMTEVVLGKYLAMLVVLLIPTLISCVYPVVLARHGNVHMLQSFGTAVGFFFMGAALTSMGLFISSLTESQAVAAGLCFVVMLLNYFLDSLVKFMPTTALTSFVALAVIAAIIALIVWGMTKNDIVGIALLFVMEAALVITFKLKSTFFEGLMVTVAEKLSLFENFYRFVEGVFDLRSLIYFITISAAFVYLTIQSMEKRRWS